VGESLSFPFVQRRLPRSRAFRSPAGDAVGLTLQQSRQYERGSNRIGSSRPYEFAKVLDVPVSYLFDEMPSNALSGRRKKR
jgi:hypothetical protein